MASDEDRPTRVPVPGKVERDFDPRHEAYEPIPVESDLDLKTELVFLLAIITLGGGTLALLARGVFWAIPLAWLAGALVASVPFVLGWLSRPGVQAAASQAPAEPRRFEREMDVSDVPGFPPALRRHEGPNEHRHGEP